MRHASTAARWASRVAVLAAFASASAPAGAQGKAAAPLSPELQAAKAALAKYADPIVAVRDGYLSTVACVEFSQQVTDGPIVYPAGAMGVHLLNTANIGPTLDPAKPQILLYERVGNKLILTGAEWFMPAAAANGTAPQIFGQTLAGPMDGHEPIIPASLRHYDLHVWLWKNNPKGMFTTTNSAVKCPKGSEYTLDLSTHHH